MKMQIPPWLKPGIWGAVIGAVAIAIVGFSAGWVVTSGSAEQLAARQAEMAVIASLTPICVAQFKSVAEPARHTHLAALQEESSWQRGDYIEEHGWATMPGAENPDDEVADACASQLLKLAEA